MPTITSTLAIGGTTVNRAAARVTLQRLQIGLQGNGSLDFTQEVASSLAGSYAPGQAVTLSMTDGTTTTTVFRGAIEQSVIAGVGTGTISVGYHCEGTRFYANKIATTASDGTGQVVYNLPDTDPNWSLNLSGLSVGTIISDYLTLHSTPLAALGVSLPPGGDLSGLTMVPNSPVYMTGPILDAVDNLLSTWGYANNQCYIDPSSLQARVVDTTALPARTLTAGTDPITVSGPTVDTSNCYTQAVLRGGDWTTAAVLRVSESTLVGEASSGGGWTPAQQSPWNWSAYATPSNQVIGTITSMTTSTVTADAFAGQVTTWGVNYWNQGQIWVYTSGAVTTSETSEVTAVTATSGGSATFTVDPPFGSTTYGKCEIRGTPLGASAVWRKYMIPSTVTRVTDGSPINLHLVQTLNGSVPWNPSGFAVVETFGPAAEVYSGTGQSWFATIQVIPSPDGVTPGYILFTQPTVAAFNSQSNLNSGGSSVTAPSDVAVLVPYSLGALSVTAPIGGGHSGTAYSRYGIQRTLYRDYPGWRSTLQNSPTSMQVLANNILASVNNAVISGTVAYLGVPLALMTLGKSLNLAGALFAGTQFTSMAAAIRNITVEWPDYGGAYQVTQLFFTNKRMAYTGDSLFLHPLSQRSPASEGFAVGGKVSYGGITGDNIFAAGQGGEMPDMSGAGDDSPGRYRKPSERREDRKKAAAERKAEDRQAALFKEREEAEAKDARERRREHDAPAQVAARRKQADRARVVARHAQQDREQDARVAKNRRRDDAREGYERDQGGRDAARTGPLAETMRGSDQGIVDAHRSAYGDGGDEELAAND